MSILCFDRSSIVFSTRKNTSRRWRASIFGALLQESNLEEKRARSKDQIVDLLRTEGERWSRWVEGLPEALLAEQIRMPGGASQSRFEWLLGTKEHEMHHRAQLMVIERLLGIVPHLTRNRQPVRETAGS